jgi:hypothetical protein
LICRSLGVRDDGFARGRQLVVGYSKNGRYQLGFVLIVNLHDVSVRVAVRQLEDIRAGGQNLTGNLH